MCEQPIVNPPSWRLGERMRQSKLNSLFQLPPDEAHIDDWSAAISKTILQQGRLYLFTNYVCFFSKLFGDDSREVIKLTDVGQMSKKRNGIEIVVQTGEKYFFTSFVVRMRSNAFEALLKAWKSATMSSDSTDSGKQAKASGDDADDDDDSRKKRSSLDESDDGIIVDMSSGAVDSVGECSKEATSSSAHSAGSDTLTDDVSVVRVTPLPAMESSQASASFDEAGEKNSRSSSGSRSSKGSRGSKGSKGSKSSDPNEAMTVHDGNVIYLWEPPPTSSIHHIETPMCETHHDHFDRVDLLQFFHLFYSDASGDFAENAHKELEEFNLVSEPWTEKENGGKTRLLSFRSNLHGIPVGPSSTRMTELQWYSLTPDMLVVRTVQNSLDVPYADYFDVENVWEFVRSLQGGVDVSVKCGVHWVKKTWLKSQVESTTLKKCRECHRKWCDAIKNFMSFHMDQLGKRLVPGELNEASIRCRPPPAPAAAAAGAAVTPANTASACDEASERSDVSNGLRHRKHKHRHHDRGDSADPSSLDLMTNNNKVRTRLVVTNKEKGFSPQHLVMMAVWLLTVLYLVARIMALERDVERLSSIHNPQSPPPPPSSSSPTGTGSNNAV